MAQKKGLEGLYHKAAFWASGGRLSCPLSEEPVTCDTWDEAMAREVWRLAGEGAVSRESEAEGTFNYG